jgi:hypothetical protein
MSEPKPTSRLAVPTYAVTVLLGLAIVYFLSVGPAGWLFRHKYITPEQFRFCYWPIRFLCGQSEWLNSVVHWYVELFS